MTDPGQGYEQALSEFREILEYQPPGSLLREGHISRLEDLIAKYPAEAREIYDDVCGEGSTS